MKLTLWIVACCAILVTASLLLDVVRIEGNSMVPSLCDQDVVLATGQWVHLLPRNWLIGSEILAKPPKRDLMVKRIVAAGGDRVRIEHGRLILNGVKSHEPYVCDANADYFETWPYQSRDNSKDAYTIPANEVFLIGDNRAHSSDSRVMGTLPASSILGLVMLRLHRGECGCSQDAPPHDVADNVVAWQSHSP